MLEQVERDSVFMLVIPLLGRWGVGSHVARSGFLFTRYISQFISYLILIWMILFVSNLVDIICVCSGVTVEVTAELIEARAVLILQTLSTLSVATVCRPPSSSQHV